MAAKGLGAKLVHDGPLDDSLTSLHWLHNLNATTLATPTPPVTPEPGDDGSRVAQMKVDPNHALGTSYRRAAAAAKSDPRSAAAAHGAPATAAAASRALERIDYKTNANVKPPYSYATLICMAMTESKKSKITLAAIYSWIMENFLYYRLADPSWQNSIRHNLSLNKCFEKVPRQKDEPGKGGFWRINSEYSELLESGIYKRRRCSTRDDSAAAAAGGGEPRPAASLDDSGHSPTKRMREYDFDDDDEGSIFSLQDDVNFNALLGQDIEINGVRLRAEDLLETSGSGDAAAAAAGARPDASSLLEASPPPSESSSDDLDEFLRSNLTPLAADGGGRADGGGGGLLKDGADGGVDALSLSVQGVRIEPPDWWLDSLNSTAFRGLLHSSLNSATLLPPPPAAGGPRFGGGAGAAHHPWSADRSELDEAIAALDADALLFN